MACPIPQSALNMIELLNEKGFSAYAVGGCVRDTLMKLTPHDFDLATDALPEEIKAVFSGCKMVLDGEKHGTVTVIMNHCPVEITTFRRDGDYADHRHPKQVSFSKSLSDDLSRRDFTINAMAMDKKGEIIDLFGGREDIKAGVIRCVGLPNQRFEEDALRILRGLRFSARLGFAIEQQTALRMHEKKGLLSFVSRERIQAELIGILQGKNAGEILRLYPDILCAALPGLNHDLSAQALALDRLSQKTPLLCLTALLWPLETGDALQICRHLRLSAKLQQEISLLLRKKNALSDAFQVRFLLSGLGSDLFDGYLLLLQAFGADPVLMEQAAAEKKRLIEQKICLNLKNLAIDGTCLKGIGFTAKSIGMELEKLLFLALTEQIPNSRDALAAQAERDFQSS